MAALMEKILQEAVSKALKDLFNADLNAADVTINDTRKDFEGDLTVVTFPLLRYTKKSPEESGRMIGEILEANVDQIDKFNVVKGFLNLSFNKAYWQEVVNSIWAEKNFGLSKDKKEKVMVEYSSPNTNKPLHLGHIRNNVLGFAVSELLEANGHEVIKANLINDRGIHICKSMLAWQNWGNGETPESTGMKGDHLVGKYYVLFDKQFKKEIAEMIAGGAKEEEAKKSAPVMKEAQEMLRKWEAGDADVMALWKQMNSWVYEGFDKTYTDLGVRFDKYYYESNTYLMGKEVVQNGLDDGIFFTKDDGSVWIDLQADGLDEKLLLRADGTSVYMTQDIGTAELKYKDFQMSRSIYVVGNEQDYHFKVLKLICQKLKRNYADGIQHLSYGMVELPSGKMKSREGTVVDADDLISEMISAARERTQELGKIEGFSDEEAEALYHTIALGALKFYLLKVDPKRNMMFNPEESIDLQGYTGPFVQYTHARICSIGRKSGFDDLNGVPNVDWDPQERELIKYMSRFPSVMSEAGKALNPAAVVDYAYHLAKAYNKYYAEVSILGAPTEELKQFRVMLSLLVARTVKTAFNVVGIEVPERM